MTKVRSQSTKNRTDESMRLYEHSLKEKDRKEKKRKRKRKDIIVRREVNESIVQGIVTDTITSLLFHHCLGRGIQFMNICRMIAVR